MQSAKVRNRLLRGETLVQGGRRREETNIAPNVGWLCLYIETGNACCPLGRRDDSRKHPQQRGLSGAVRPQQTEDFAGMTCEGHIPNRFNLRSLRSIKCLR